MIYITMLLIISGGVGQEGVTIGDKQVQDSYIMCHKANCLLLLLFFVVGHYRVHNSSLPQQRLHAT